MYFCEDAYICVKVACVCMWQKFLRQGKGRFYEISSQFTKNSNYAFVKANKSSLSTARKKNDEVKCTNKKNKKDFYLSCFCVFIEYCLTIFSFIVEDPDYSLNNSRCLMFKSTFKCPIVNLVNYLLLN